jgi:oxygen-independent coproporphyrinogen III oxidase
MEQLRLYIHIPFCNYACTFCFFSKYIGADRDKMTRYINALKRELEWIPPGMPLSQLFVGGGTPTCLPPDLMDDFLSTIFERTTRNETSVHTVEASPESITEEHIAVLKKHGIGRISMGVQSLDQETLDGVNRRHDGNQSLAACKMIIDNGFILNVDLMYGLPDQTYDDFRRDLEILESSHVPSVTLYDLRINEQTPIARTITGDKRWDLSQLMGWRAFVRQTAKELGYTQSRWHTYKKMDSIAAKHERLKCFTSDGKGYQFGAGLSARSQLGYTLFRNTRNLKTYLERIEAGTSPVEETIPLSLADRKTQFVARTLGDGKPLFRHEYEEAFGTTIDDDFGEAIMRLTDNGIVSDSGQSMTLTDTGKLVYDLVTVSFYPADAYEWLQENTPTRRAAMGA